MAETWILNDWRAWNDLKIISMKHVFNTYLKAAPTAMYTKTDVQQQILFEKIMKTRVSDLFGGPKWPDSPEAHILHTTKSSSSEHAKQDWYKSNGNFLTI